MAHPSHQASGTFISNFPLGSPASCRHLAGAIFPKPKKSERPQPTKFVKVVCARRLRSYSESADDSVASHRSRRQWQDVPMSC